MSATISPSDASPVGTGPIALAGAPRPAGAPKPKPRKRVNTAEKRHQHNAIERQRRETLNSKFLVLARLLPSLASCRRPSKSAIVNGSISHLTYQRQQRLLAAKLLRQLSAERDELMVELNQWRQANGCPPKRTLAMTDEIEEICAVENEKFGSFANVDENGDDQGDEDEDNNEAPYETMKIETANLVAGSYSTGLVTPRSSTDMSAPLPVNGFNNWPATNFSVPTAAPTLPFNTFMSPDADSVPSPVDSSHNAAMLTPKSAVDITNMYTHTPSPPSASSPDESGSSARQGSPSWTPQQIAMFQQQVQHQSMQQQRHHLGAAPLPTPAQGGNDLSNIFLGQQQQQQQQQPHPQGQPGLAHFMASMFPQQNNEQVEHWRKIALSGYITPGQHQDTRRLGGFNGLNNSWSEQAVGV